MPLRFVEFRTSTETLRSCGTTVTVGVGGLAPGVQDVARGLALSERWITRNQTIAVSRHSAPMNARAGNGRRRSGAVILSSLPGCSGGPGGPGLSAPA